MQQQRSEKGLGLHLVVAVLLASPVIAGCEKRVAPQPEAPAGGGDSGGSAGAPGGEQGAPGSGGNQGGARSYTLFWTVQKEPAGGVTVAIEVPTAWKEKVDGMGGPVFEGSGVSYGPSVVLLPAAGADDKARVEALVQRQYDAAALAAAEREDGADGSVWIASKRADGYVDARRFVAAGGDKGVVVCVISLSPKEAEKLPELKRVCATLKLSA